MTTRLVIDWVACEGRGVCAELVPEILATDPWGYPVSVTGERNPVVAKALTEHARTAVKECPRMALRLTHEREPAS